MTLHRRKPARSGIRDDSGPIRCPAHLKWIRGCACLLAGKHECSGRIEAAHVRGAGGGGMGLKPGDHLTIPLCTAAHREQHSIGEAAFERRYGMDLRYSAGAAWAMSPAGKRYRMEKENV